jgi:hypothetical protein
MVVDPRHASSLPRRGRRLEQQGGEIAEIAPPDPPVMCAIGFDVRVLDTALLERLVQTSTVKE